MQKDLDKIFTTVNKDLSEAKDGLDSIIENEGLSQEQIERWIEHLTQIIRKTDHVIEMLEESKSRG